MNRLQRQLLRYVLVGLSGVGIDAVLYAFFLHTLGFPIPVAKTIGVVAGVAYGYFMHCHFTFAARVTLKGLVAYCILYAVSIVQNVVTNSLLAMYLPRDWHPLVVAFLTATGISVCINFIGMKLIVFKKT